MIKIGMVINDRYEIIEKIGTGGMSDVYKALDEKLNRNVAVKVLKQEFGDNENFVSKFRVEAQAAAGLMHPNIVNVYDVGEEGEIHYIVMELVEGITLKKYIEKKARLTYKEAVSIAIQVSLGIEAAHGNHIIHRDIKPQNIIISRDGKVKVTDFGIAKAATSNTITSNVMGSVHYTSPEQARGGYSDEKSDIYSLGISMFEMLTGRVPFNGETTVAIAIKHIQEAMPSCREYVPEIPQCVESIIFKCTEKSPDRRYQNMQEVIKDLKQALLTPEVDFVDRESAEMMGGTRVVSESEMAQIKNTRTGAPVESGNTDRLMTLAPGVGAAVKAKEEAAQEPYYEQEYQGENYENGEYPEEAGYEQEGYTDENGEYYEENYEGEDYTEGYSEGYTDEQYGEPEYVEEPPVKAKKKSEDSGLEDEEDYNPKVEKITTIVAIAAGVIIVALIVVLLITTINGCFSSPMTGNTNTNDNDSNTSHVLPEPDEETGDTQPEVKKVIIPKIVGENVDDVRNKLYALGLVTSVSYENSDTVPSESIISASVKEGDEVDAGIVVALVVSNGKGGVKLPNVAGMTYESAYSALTKEGFSVTKKEEYSSTVEEGYVISQDPAAADNIPSGSQIVLIVSKGKENIKVPNLLGLTEEEATVCLVEYGLKVGTVTKVNNESFDKDLVCQQSVNSGSYVPEGTTIDITISLGTAVKTYKYEANITAPTNDECPQYKSGTGVKVILKTADGKELLNTTVTNFPITGSYYGLTSATGTITMSFT
ncbi:MAG: Stk1 family PASTA domain-containing Ser/Thr kinase, partial [Lachnospiraceae bacterium]|nr:Stk1 family PASTA domain-containing Ser/Thr kinase [Lachnospiraceae bacterium]